MWNECVMVVNFDGVKVQMPSFDKKKIDSVYVKYENEKYTLSSELEHDKSLKSIRNKHAKLETSEVDEEK